MYVFMYCMFVFMYCMYVHMYSMCATCFIIQAYFGILSNTEASELTSDCQDIKNSCDPSSRRRASPFKSATASAPA